MEEKKSLLRYGWGLLVGFLNGLLGAGGGMVAVPTLRRMGLKTEEAHATSISIILPLAIASGGIYFKAGHFTVGDALPYLPGGLLGAVLGGWLLPRVNPTLIRRIFGGVILFSAGKLLFW